MLGFELVLEEFVEREYFIVGVFLVVYLSVRAWI